MLIKHCRWTVSTTYVFREKVKNNELAVNPLGCASGATGVQLGIHRPPRGLFVPIHAANPASFTHLTPCKVIQTNCSLQTSNGGGGPRSPYVGYACWNRTAIAANFDSQCADGNPVLERVCRYVSRFLLGHSFGASPAPGGTRSSASRSAPLWGHGSSQNKFYNHGKKRLSNFFRAPPRKQPIGTWEPGPLARLHPV